jgi:hypothetical protein
MLLRRAKFLQASVKASLTIAECAVRILAAGRTRSNGLATVKTEEMGVVRERLSAITSTLGVFYDSESLKLEPQTTLLPFATLKRCPSQSRHSYAR